MKKLLIICLLAFVVFSVSDLIAPQEAQALLPLACMTANDFGWRNYGWNVLCIWHLQLEGYGELDGYTWTQVKPDADYQVATEKTYVLNTAVQWQRLRYPIRA